jgi:hypothetical protein
MGKRGRRIETQIKWATGGSAFLLAMLLLTGGLHNISLGAANPASATPFVCAMTGTPVSRDDSPILQGCDAVGVGTPIAAEGLTVTLTLSSNQAAPQDIVVAIRDANGAPVDDATVTLINRHLEMDHGDFVHQLGRTGSGQYGALKVGMGMGGRWQTEIVVERPGQPTVSVFFLVKLEGLM